MFLALKHQLVALPGSVYAIGQLALLGVPSLVFTPLLLRWVGVDVVATVLVAQVYVYFLVIVQQFGFNLTGPARLARAGAADGSAVTAGALRSTWRFKAALFVVNVLVWAGVVASVFDGAIGLLAFMGLLLSHVLNANWYLQSRQDFYTGAFSAGAGVGLGLLLLAIIWGGQQYDVVLPGLMAWAVAVMIAPQVILGVGTYWRAVRQPAPRLGANAWPLHEIWQQGWPLVVGQILLIATTTLGTVVVSQRADADVTAAYAATEKLFNLAATAMIALYAVHYPQLARAFQNNVAHYWQEVWRKSGRIALWGLVGLLLVFLAGDTLLSVYLGHELAGVALPVLVPMTLWLVLVPFQNALQCHLAVVGQTSMSIRVACLMLLVELLVGGALMSLNPVYWAYGMLASQLPALVVMAMMCRSDRPLRKVG